MLALGQNDLSLPVEVQPFQRDALPVDLGQPALQRPAGALRCVEADGQIARLHGHRRADEGDRDRQGRGPGLLTEIDGQIQHLRRVLVIRRQPAIDLQRFGIEAERIQFQPTGGGAPALGDKPGIAAKEGPVLRRQQRGQIAADLHVEAAAGGAVRPLGAGEGDLAGDARLPVGGDLDIGGIIAERAFAMDVGGDGGAALDPGHAAEQALGVLVQRQVDIQHPAVIVETAVEGEIALLAISAVDDDIGLALAALQRHRAGNGDGRILAQQFLAQNHAFGIDLLDPDADRKLGKVEAAGFGTVRGLRGLGMRAAGDLDPPGAEFADLDPAAQQGRARPLDRAIFQPQPGAVGIGDGDALEGRAR